MTRVIDVNRDLMGQSHSDDVDCYQSMPSRAKALPKSVDAKANGKKRKTKSVTPEGRRYGESLGERWRDARESVGLGANELDYAMGRASTGFSSTVESGSRPLTSAFWIGKGAEACGVRKGWLAFGEEPRHAPPGFERVSLVPASAVAAIIESSSLRRALRLAGDQVTIWELGALVEEIRRNPSLLREDGSPASGTWEELLQRHSNERRQARLRHLERMGAGLETTAKNGHNGNGHDE